MLEQSKFLVSFDCQNEKFCEELIITYRTEELRPYLIFPRVKLNPNLKRYGNTTANIHWEYTHPKLQRNNMITSLIAGQEMTNTNISMTTTRTNTQSITKN